MCIIYTHVFYLCARVWVYKYIQARAYIYRRERISEKRKNVFVTIAISFLYFTPHDGSNGKNGARVVTMCNAMQRNENHFGRVTFLPCVRYHHYRRRRHRPTALRFLTITVTYSPAAIPPHTRPTSSPLHRAPSSPLPSFPLRHHHRRPLHDKTTLWNPSATLLFHHLLRQSHPLSPDRIPVASGTRRLHRGGRRPETRWTTGRRRRGGH